MDSVQKEAMAVAMELKRILSLRLCNEISDEQYRSQRERLLNDFNIISKQVVVRGSVEVLLWPSPHSRHAESMY